MSRVSFRTYTTYRTYTVSQDYKKEAQARSHLRHEAMTKTDFTKQPSLRCQFRQLLVYLAGT